MLMFAVQNLAGLSTCMSQSEQSEFTRVMSPTSFAVKLHTHFSNSRNQRFVFERRATEREKPLPSVHESKSNTSLYVLTQADGRDITESYVIVEYNQHVCQFVPGQQRDLLEGLDDFNQAQHSMSWAQRTMLR